MPRPTRLQRLPILGPEGGLPEQHALAFLRRVVIPIEPTREYLENPVLALLDDGPHLPSQFPDRCGFCVS